jgi:hypothetical protein
LKNNKKDGLQIEKDSVVLTTPTISNHIYNELKRKRFKNVLDIGSHSGNLSKPFKRKAGLQVHGIDVIDDYKDNFDTFIHKDFLSTSKKDFENKNIDLIVSNPPFQKHKEKGDLYPILFLNHIFTIFPKNMPVVMIIPHYLLSNSTKRIETLNNLNINKITTLHKKIFATPTNDINIESVILFINIKTKKEFDFLAQDKATKQPKRTYKNVSLNKKQQDYLNYIKVDNFSNFVKNLIREKFPNF